jgi:hypothetical protein
MKTPHLQFIEAAPPFGCCVCPVDNKKCEAEKRQQASCNNHFDCYGALMRWLFWGDKDE